MTLEELKEQNAKAAAEQQDAQPVHTEDAEAQADPDDNQETDGDQDEAQEVPLWMQSDEQASGESGQVPVQTHIAVKQKLKGKLRDQSSEIEELKNEIQQLKVTHQTVQPVATPQVPPKQVAIPKAEDFYDAKDPDAAYQLAMQNWVNQGVETRLQTHLKTQHEQQQRQQMDSRINQQLDHHYNRAAAIVSEGLLTADEYQSSETLVRQAVEQVAPGNGDTYVDSLLGRLGEGSEKVVIALSRSANHLSAFQQALRDDPSGISAASYLGELKGRFHGAKPVSKTPRPGTRLQGDAPVDGGADQRRYKAAHKSGDRQKAFDIKRAAKGRGVDVSKW